MHPDVNPNDEDVREWTSFEAVLPNHHYTFPDSVEDIKDWLVPITFWNCKATENNGTVLRAPAEAAVTEVLGSRYCSGCCRIRMTPYPFNSEPLNLVCKFLSTVRDDLIKSLEDQARFYETQLKTLQGSIAPKF
ncbi:hypothetical protein SCHPADRAFT_925779 [Schizopora paradoxa]|uniref:Uncharacterized protein n=1 Tax=Schizopora paradoxa TaxID=27342 RepID=A0A0H2S0S2_9AGAM|nr:hypothetical protein SCHPADRAFT_925779 [Schizopora paradoxa]